MDFYLVNGTHFANPAQPRRLFAHPLRAAEAAMDLVNCLRADLDPVALPPAVAGSWFEALSEAQRYRLASQGIPVAGIAECDLPDLAEFDVWIEVHSVDISTGRQITAQATFDEVERDAILAALRLLQARGCPAELLDIATNGESHAILSDDAIDVLCERLNTAGYGQLPRVVVTLEGGLVSGAVADQPVNLLVIDYDVEGAADDEISEIPQDNGRTAGAIASFWTGAAITNDPAWIDAALAALDGAGEA